MKHPHAVAALAAILLPLASLAQEFTPVVHLYGKNDYSADNQNWAVAQGDDGVMYFGNGGGMLSFNGLHWQLHKLPLAKTARSLYADKDRIYVGSYEEFGYFDKTSTGTLEYVSLSESLGTYRMQNDEIWRILKVGDKIVFQSFTSWFVWDGQSVVPHRSSSVFMFFSEWNGKVFTGVSPSGFSGIDLESGLLSPIKTPFSSLTISVDSLPGGNALVSTYDEGLFLYDGKKFAAFRTEADDILRKSRINRVKVVSDSIIVIGTLLGGVTAVNPDGKKLWTVNTSNVLQSNTVLGICPDRDGNIWLALDVGIAMVENNAGIRYVKSIRPSVGAVYDVEYMRPYIYLATNQGLYRAELTDGGNSIGNVSRYAEIQGNVWDISSFGGQTFIGTNSSTFELCGDGRLERIPGADGGMAMAYGRIAGRDVLIQGTYTYLDVYVKEKGKWVFSHSLTEFMNPVNSVFIDHTGTIWAGHMHSGLYAVRLTSDLRHVSGTVRYDSLNGKDRFPVRVSDINNVVVFMDGTGFYTYDMVRRKIIPFKELNSVFPPSSGVYRICRHSPAEYWFISQYEAALVSFSPDGYEIEDVVSYRTFGSRVVDGNQNVICVGTEPPLSIFTLENSMAFRYGGSRRRHDTCGRLGLAEFKAVDVSSSADTLLSVTAGRGKNAGPKLPWSKRNVSAEIAFPCYGVGDVTFSYMLENFEKVWHTCDGSHAISYSYLPHGNYVLRIKAETRNRELLDAFEYQFSIAPPFYFCFWAKLFYCFSAVSVIFLLRAYVRRRMREKDLALKHIRDEYAAAMENERLQSELKIKGKELASSTMAVINKNETLIKIREELVCQKQSLGNNYPKACFNKLTEIIDKDLDNDGNWNVFYRNFDFIHENFFRHLQERYPDLTPTDLRFCAYLRMNLTSKDMASLMNISLKGVETARYRLRKKLKLSSDVSLSSFLIDFK